jgi:uncharacterized protein (TIGR02172 family)
MTTSLSTPVAQGRTAEVYAWDDNHVLKLYRDWWPSSSVEDEATIARAVHSAGVPSPAAGEIIEVNGRLGLIYERIEGISMLRDMNAHPWTIIAHARSLADLHVKIHQQSIPGLPSYKDHLWYDISKGEHLTEDLRKNLLGMLDVLPDGKQLCHGDYHPGNVILAKEGPVVIDWLTACSGNPWADVARTSMILNVGVKGAGRQVSSIVRMAILLYYRLYLRCYHMLVPDVEHEWNRWLPLIAAARLNENIIPEREALMQMVKAG